MEQKLYDQMDWAGIEELVYSEASDPHRLLGPHVTEDGLLIQAFIPGAQSITVKLTGNGKKYPMELADEAGFFAVLVPRKTVAAYTLLVTFEGGGQEEIHDPYAFAPLYTDEDIKKFAAGIHYNIYEKMGAHPMTIDGVEGVYFSVWAPCAMRVSVVGDFNQWDGRRHQMRKVGWDDACIFELFIPGLKQGDIYKYEIKTRHGEPMLKADPYANYAELRPNTASVIWDINRYQWQDKAWMEKRAKTDTKDKPMNIYEVHLGSWIRKELAVDEAGEPITGSEFYNYRETAERLAAYVKEMGYTHVELMPVMEHPLDGSWGYQVTGYYAPTSRYGTPDDFMAFMDYMHQQGIGVILDWVPAHFPRDAYGMAAFDGTCVYEHADPRKGAHPHWGTLIYNYGRPGVSNFLIANALFWADKYHADGIRMDAVASMLYLDYGKNDGEWVANIYGGNENLQAVEFLKHVNSMIHKRGRGALSIAEESTAWPKVTGSLDDDGLGFDLKWNMGWMNDFLGYIRQDPYFRSGCHNMLTFSMVYAYSEKFMLVLSHDEVVHGKASMLGKMPGNRQEQFSNLKASYGYMMCHPGKKLLFMGQDIGEYDEWNENREVEWYLTKEADHKGLQEFVKALNRLYASAPALSVKDTSWDGFEWINCISANDCDLSFVRKGEKDEDMLLVVVNFANVERKNFQVGVPLNGKYKEILNSDAKEFGGEGRTNPRVKTALEEEWDGREYSIKMTQAPLSISIFSYQPYTKEELKEIARKKAEKARKEKEAARRKQNAKNAKKTAPGKTKTLKEELAEKVFAADAEISEKGEVEKPVRVVKTAEPAAAKRTLKSAAQEKPEKAPKTSRIAGKEKKGTDR